MDFSSIPMPDGDSGGYLNTIIKPRSKSRSRSRSIGRSSHSSYSSSPRSRTRSRSRSKLRDNSSSSPDRPVGTLNRNKEKLSVSDGEREKNKVDLSKEKRPVDNYYPQSKKEDRDRKPSGKDEKSQIDERRRSKDDDSKRYKTKYDEREDDHKQKDKERRPKERRSRSPDHDKQKRRSISREKRRSRSRERRRSRSRSPADRRSHYRDSRSYQRSYRDRDRDRNRDKDRERERERGRDRDKDRDRRSPRRRSRSRERDRRRDSSRDRDRHHRRGYEKKPSKLTILERLGIEIPTTPAAVTPQQLIQKSLELQVQQVKSSTGIELPSYYNPAAMNPARYAEQMQKRKLLWGSKTQEVAKEEKPEVIDANKWKATTFAQDDDGRMTAKFKRLMGIKDNESSTGPANDKVVTGASTSTSQDGNECLKKQEELFKSMELQYEVARVATHTQRGVGLGFGTFQYPP